MKTLNQQDSLLDNAKVPELLNKIEDLEKKNKKLELQNQALVMQDKKRKALKITTEVKGVINNSTSITHNPIEVIEEYSDLKIGIAEIYIDVNNSTTSSVFTLVAKNLLNEIIEVNKSEEFFCENFKYILGYNSSSILPLIKEISVKKPGIQENTFIEFTLKITLSSAEVQENGICTLKFYFEDITPVIADEIAISYLYEQVELYKDEEINSLKEQFKSIRRVINNIRHDISTPITALSFVIFSFQRKFQNFLQDVHSYNKLILDEVDDNHVSYDAFLSEVFITLTHYINKDASREVLISELLILQKKWKDFKRPILLERGNKIDLVIEKRNVLINDFFSNDFTSFANKIDSITNNLFNHVNALGNLSSDELDNTINTNISLIDVSGVLNRVIDIVATDEFKAQRIKIIYNIPISKLALNTHSLEIVLQNYIQNALKYTSEKVIIRISYLKDTSQEWLLIEVEDCGDGISKEDLPKIFDLGFRSESIRNNIPGTGIGLGSVASTLQLNGGEFWVKSIMGVGSIFYAKIPIR